MRICVFCGASPGRDPAYAELAWEVGAGLAGRGIGLVYGGGRVGLMGAVADAALAAGGEVIGVIPSRLVDRELAHRAVTDLRVVDTLHARKAMMAELSEGFIALPGGYGTLEELAEVISWAQLDLHTKPIGLLGHGGVGNLADLVTLVVEVVTDHAARDRADGRADQDPRRVVSMTTDRRAAASSHEPTDDGALGGLGAGKRSAAHSGRDTESDRDEQRNERATALE